MRHRLKTCAGSTAAFAVAFTALGTPAWAQPEPEVPERPPVGEENGSPAVPSDTSPSGDGDTESPEVAASEAKDSGTEVAPFDEARSREYFAVLPDTVSPATAAEVRKLSGVESITRVDAAQVEVEGEQTSVLGVDPSQFRNYAPKPSATSDEVWQGIADGGIALSDTAGKQRELDVGSEVSIAGGNGTDTREVWTHTTSGVAGIDALISQDAADDLDFPDGNGLVISAPEADLWELYEELGDTLGEDASLQLLADDPAPRPDGAGGAPVTDPVVEEMISAAQSQRGVPYVWGGETPRGGFDCSGLVQWAFGQAGVSVPRVTHDQWYEGERIEYADAQRGDLIFWRTDPTAPDYISHVAIYLGDGKMLEAPRTGLDVRVTDVRTDSMAGVVRVHTG